MSLHDEIIGETSTEAVFQANALLGSADRSREDLKRSLVKLGEALESHYDFELVRATTADTIQKIQALRSWYDRLEKYSK